MRNDKPVGIMDDPWNDRVASRHRHGRAWDDAYNPYLRDSVECDYCVRKGTRMKPVPAWMRTVAWAVLIAVLWLVSKVTT